MSLVVRVADHINHHGAGEEEHVVFAFRDVHAVSVVPTEPALGYFGDFSAATLKAVFQVQETALRFEVVRAGHIHGEFAAEEREEMFLHHGQ